MKITAIRAYALNVTAQLDITDNIKTAGHQVCVVEIDTDEGITGHGLTAIGPAVPIKAAVLSVAAPELMGADFHPTSGSIVPCAGLLRVVRAVIVQTGHTGGHLRPKTGKAIKIQSISKCDRAAMFSSNPNPGVFVIFSQPSLGSGRPIYSCLQTSTEL